MQIMSTISNSQTYNQQPEGWPEGRTLLYPFLFLCCVYHTNICVKSPPLTLIYRVWSGKNPGTLVCGSVHIVHCFLVYQRYEFVPRVQTRTAVWVGTMSCAVFSVTPLPPLYINWPWKIWRPMNWTAFNSYGFFMDSFLLLVEDTS